MNMHILEEFLDWWLSCYFVCRFETAVSNGHEFDTRLWWNAYRYSFFRVNNAINCFSCYGYVYTLSVNESLQISIKIQFFKIVLKCYKNEEMFHGYYYIKLHFINWSIAWKKWQWEYKKSCFMCLFRLWRKLTKN